MHLLFIPGLLTTKEVWSKLNFFRHDFSVYDADVSSFDSIIDMANMVECAIDHHCNYCVIGISMGGYVALELATRQNSWIKKLVLINTSAKAVNPDSLHSRKQAITLAKTNGIKSVLNLHPGICFYAYTPKMKKVEARMAEEIGVEAYLRQQKAIINRQAHTPKLGNIVAETLIITALADKVLAFKDSLELHQGIDRSTLFSLRHCGHLPTLERPDDTFLQVASFLTGTEQ